MRVVSPILSSVMRRREKRAKERPQSEEEALRDEVARLRRRLDEADRVIASHRPGDPNGREARPASGIVAERLAMSILEQAAEPIIVLDAHDRITHSSRQAAVLAGQDPLGKAFETVFPLRMQDDSPSIGGHIIGREAIFERADERRFYVHYSRSPLRDQSGSDIGSVIVLADISRSKQVEEELRRSRKDLQRLNESLEERVLLRTRELSRANIALINKNRELQDFAYVASHDLQEPLRKISSFADLLTSEFGSELHEDAIAYLDRMRGAAIRMSDLLRGLLAFSRVLTEARPFRMVDLKSAIEDVVSDLQVLIEETGASIEIGTMPSVEADAVQMRQLFQNLIGNSIKFAKDGKTPAIRIKAKLVESGGSEKEMVARIEVADNGIGFDQKYLDRIFAPFQRLHGRSAYPGTGMGLAICRRIVERHHGDLTAESAPGEGARFVVTLPVVQIAGTDEE
jgi:PAS domain S-box-containing protein